MYDCCYACIGPPLFCSSPLLANGSSGARSRRASLQPEGASASPWRAALSDDVSKFSFAEPQASSGLGAAKPLLKTIMGSVRRPA
jgi:hypothetical protein